MGRLCFVRCPECAEADERKSRQREIMNQRLLNRPSLGEEYFAPHLSEKEEP
jgi:hypothetical protein